MKKIATSILALTISLSASAEHINPKNNLPNLHQAIIENNFDKVKSLVENGADVNQLDKKMGNAPLHIAAQGGTPEMINLLIANGAFVNLQTPKAGFSPLMVATWYSKPANIKALLKAEDINVNLKTPAGVMAEQWAGGWDRDLDENEKKLIAEIKKIFADYRAGLNIKLESQVIMQTLLDKNLTEEQKTAKVAELIKQGAEVDTVQPVIGNGNDTHTPLLVAARSGYTKIVEMLLNAGADQRKRGYMMDAISLHKGGYMGHPEVLDLLVNAKYINEELNAQGPNNGYTPLHDAIWHGHTKAAEVLINAGARTDLKNYEGDTPLDLAKRYKYNDIVKLLEK
tara:strand:- start:3070 stop:4092 length:1023 start_codon:yes stop_codon:yes gene_type:complete